MLYLKRLADVTQRAKNMSGNGKHSMRRYTKLRYECLRQLSSWERASRFLSDQETPENHPDVANALRNT